MNAGNSQKGPNKLSGGNVLPQTSVVFLPLKSQYFWGCWVPLRPWSRAPAVPRNSPRNFKKMLTSHPIPPEDGILLIVHRGVHWPSGALILTTSLTPPVVLIFSLTRMPVLN